VSRICETGDQQEAWSRVSRHCLKLPKTCNGKTAAEAFPSSRGGTGSARERPERRYVTEKFATRLAKRIKDAEEKGSFPPVSPEQTANVIGFGEPEGKRQEAAAQMMEEMLIYYNVHPALSLYPL